MDSFTNLAEDETLIVNWEYKENEDEDTWIILEENHSDICERSYYHDLGKILIENGKYRYDLKNMVMYKKKSKNLYDKKKIRRVESITKITCLGCLEDQPNQLAHMGYGGCLNDEYFKY